MPQKKQSDKEINREIKKIKKEISTKIKEKEKFYKDQLKRIKTIREKPKLAPVRFSQAAWEKKYKAPKLKMLKRTAKKSISRRLIGKSLSKFMPGAGVATAALYVIEGVSKATCSKRGGKWVSGKCKGAKKSTRKITSPQARDLKSKR